MGICCWENESFPDFFQKNIVFTIHCGNLKAKICIEKLLGMQSVFFSFFVREDHVCGIGKEGTLFVSGGKGRGGGKNLSQRRRKKASIMRRKKVS